MLTIITETLDKAQLKMQLYNKQKLYAQMLKDGITGPAKEEVAEEIAEILKKLYRQLKK